MVAVGAVVVYAQQTTTPARFQPDARSAELAQARAAILAKYTPVTDAMLRNPSPNDWLQWRRTYDAHGFSPLSQINKSNVKGLTPAWTWTLPDGTGEVVPLVHDGVMFVYGFNDHIQALDAVTGDLIWEYVHPPVTGAPWPGIAGTSRRNFAIYGDKLFYPTFDGHEVALDVKTGKVVWDHKISDRELPYRASSGPIAVNGKLIQGMTNCSRLQPGGCIILALDAETGNEAWRIHTIPKPGEPGDETWSEVPYEDRQGAAIWTTPSYDPELNLVYAGTGNSYAWQKMVRGNTTPDPIRSGLYIDSTLAIAPDTGKLVWHYQHLPQDMWNLDFAFERPIVTVPVNGRPQKLVCATGKMVWTDCLDAATGKWMFSHDAGLQNIVKSIDPKTGKKTYFDEVIPDLTRHRTNLICGQMKNWPASAYDASTKLLYIVIVTTGCEEEIPRAYGPNDTYTGGDQSTGAARYNPKSPGVTGRIDVVNLETKKTVWSVGQRVNMASSALATAGGLLFVGDTERWFRAYDAADGSVLWQMRLNHTVNATPMTYSVNGKQYIAISAGKGQAGHGLTPEVQWPKNDGAVLWVFQIPEMPAR
jgi:alcohol dehydrogenase (cytochrome c)